ncbi:hypothetical protein WA026_016394 [Henosepilachna vigintioctopunctata]|uniref:Eukaryotic translation initiation factor 3 subunit E n=1 Tax=Henosepilachna vigintioctopunctata TaxID=420089 RepID=A0AAW1UL74_9CUCU
MAKYDLTPYLSQYLDRHLVFPLLEFLSAREIYDEREILKAKLDMLTKTTMVDYIIDVRKRLYPDEMTSEDLYKKGDYVRAKQESIQLEANKLFTYLESVPAEELEKVKDSKTLLYFLMKNYKDFELSMIDTIHELAKLRYDCGNYIPVSPLLYFCSLLLAPTHKLYVSVLWGKFAAEILGQNWENALEDMNILREYIDSVPNYFGGNSLQLLQQRTWLIHWSLYVFFNHISGRELIIEMFLYKPHYLNAIQTMCPHILRYLATAVIINRGKRSALKDLVKVIQQESYTYRDPITEFLEHLYVNFDFDGARKKLHECQTVINNDFFLISCLDEFVENARLMIFETFCRIHQCISIGMLAEKLNMNPDEAECWIVNLIRNARLDAKIDSKLGHVVMGAQPLSPYQQLIEKIDSLSVRSETLSGLIDRRLKAKTDIRWGNQNF